MDFDSILRITLSFEGGYVDHPSDKGGPTNFGITQATYDRYGGGGNPVKSIKKLEVYDIYWTEYWKPSKSQYLPTPLSLLHFDASVHHRRSQAARFLQRALRVTDDGIVGPITIKAAGKRDSLSTAISCLGQRAVYFGLLVNKDESQEVFLDGWLNRIDRLVEEVSKWVREGEKR